MDSPTSQSPQGFQRHSFEIHSYRLPTYCNICYQYMSGLVRQGLKCSKCHMNVHKKCAVQRQTYCRPRKSTSQSDKKQSDDDSSGSDDQTSIVDAVFAEDDTYDVPHNFLLRNYKAPTWCNVCKKLLKGLFHQGVQCSDCKINVHKKCIELAGQNCKPSVNASSSCTSPSTDNKDLMTISEAPSGKNEMETDDAKDADKPQPDMETVTDPPSNEFNCVAEPAIQTCSESAPTSGGIRLIRVSQSVKKGKIRHGKRIIREGWMTHKEVDRDHHSQSFWTLTGEQLTFGDTPHTSKPSTIIKLSDIIEIRRVAPDQASGSFHLFEIKTKHTGTICAGIDTRVMNKSNTRGGINRGTGTGTAIAWFEAINQALVPYDKSGAKTKKTTTPIPPENTLYSPLSISDMYEIDGNDLLGSGQFGQVYGARSKLVPDRQVAVKAIDKLRFQEGQRGKLQNETQILANLKYPSIVQLYNVFETPERIFIVMEKANGDMLELILKSPLGRLSERFCKYLTTQILAALRYLHKKNIAHCDLKPENVLLSDLNPFPQVKLCDFGFARIIGEQSFRSSIVGTPAYLAPEVIQNKKYNKSLDMWSVGVVIYVCLSGTFPFNEDATIESQIENAAFMFPTNPWTTIDPMGIDLIIKLLQVNMSHRWQVDRALSHAWLHDYQTWADLRLLEEAVGSRYITYEIQDAKWQELGRQKNCHSWEQCGWKIQKSEEDSAPYYNAEVWNSIRENVCANISV